MTQSRRDHLVAQNGGGRKLFDEIELFNTDSLVKEVERHLSYLFYKFLFSLKSFFLVLMLDFFSLGGESF